MFSLFRDGPEYTKRLETPFMPTKVTLSEIHSIVPKYLHDKNTLKALFYVFRDVACAVVVYKLGWFIDLVAESLVQDYGVSQILAKTVKWGLWALYWHWQGLILAAWWRMAHEAGHGSLSDYHWVNHFVVHSTHVHIGSVLVLEGVTGKRREGACWGVP